MTPVVALVWCLFIGSPLLAAAGLLPPLPALFLCVNGALGGLVAGPVVAWRNRERGRAASLALVACLAPGAVLGVAAGAGAGHPVIHDVSTDGAEPPRFSWAAEQLPQADWAYAPDLPPVVAQAYPQVQPVVLSVSPAEAFARAEQAALALGWTVRRRAPAEGVLEATAETALFGFVDDVVVRVRPQGAGARVDVRSRSREGEGDLGVNARRIAAFSERLRKP